MVARTRDHAAVIVTAEHVVKGNDTVRVVWSGGARSVSVYRTNADLDVALVEAPRELDDVGLPIEARPEVGESGWLLGFGNGWDGQAPLVSRAMAAGVKPSGAWLDGTASWGHSGGPFVVMREDQPTVVGFVRGNMSQVHDRLKQMREQNVNVIGRLQQQSVIQPGRQDIFVIMRAHIVGAMAGVLGRVTETLDVIEQHYRAGFLDCGLGEHALLLRH